MTGSEGSRTGSRGRRGAGRAVRLRRWLLGGAVVLLAVLVGLVGYARHRARTALLDLPHRLGLDIKSETDGFTISRSEKGRPLFTIHAAKAIQHRDGKTTLRNVQVTLYGEPGTNRVDVIRGNEFQYDQTAGLVRAMGESEIDLGAPAAGGAAKPESKRIHVKANGLIFDQKLGKATTGEQIRFEYGDAHGSARGAEFDAHSGTLALQHDVHLVNEEGGRTEQVDAESALLRRDERTANLTRATLTQEGQRMVAAALLVRLRPESPGGGSSMESIDGSGGVELHSADGTVARAPMLHALVTPGNHLHEAEMSGGVAVQDAEGDGRSGTATVLFDDRGRATRVKMAQTVVLRGKQEDGSVRQLTADAVDGTLGADAKGHTVLQQSVATGHAVLHLLDDAKLGKAASDTTLAADVLHAFGEDAAGHWQVRRVVGDGGTRVEQQVAGESRVSTGAHVEMLLQAAGSSKVTGSVESFVQQGRVHAVDRRPVTAGGTAESLADADRAEYLASAGSVVLTGSPVVRDDAMEVAAARITMATATGDAEAVDGVRGSYRAKADAGKTDSGGALHFLADRVRANRSAQQATLFGSAHPVRLWNDTSQVEAPVVEVDRAKGTVFAHDASTGRAGAVVRSILPAGNGAGGGKPGRTGGTVRVLSETLRYHGPTAGQAAEAEFDGSVRMDTATGQVQCDRAVALLRSGQKPGVGRMSGAVETVNADGHVRVMQPGRVAMGTRLVYTAASQQYLLTGTAGALPTVRDSVQGNLTGTALLFHAGDDSVEVTGAPGRPVETEIDAPARKAGKK